LARDDGGHRIHWKEALVMRPSKVAGGGLITRTAAANAAMTASQHLEIALTRRPGSDLPVRISERLTGHPVAGGPARVAVGQTTQSLLAASAVIMARLMSRVPVVVAIAAESLLLVMTNAAVARVLNLGDMPSAWSHCDLATDLTHKTSLATTAVLLTRGQHAVER
jgi:hypothetical protein